MIHAIHDGLPQLPNQSKLEGNETARTLVLQSKNNINFKATLSINTQKIKPKWQNLQ